MLAQAGLGAGGILAPILIGWLLSMGVLGSLIFFGCLLFAIRMWNHWRDS